MIGSVVDVADLVGVSEGGMGVESCVRGSIEQLMVRKMASARIERLRNGCLLSVATYDKQIFLCRKVDCTCKSGGGHPRIQAIRLYSAGRL
jgi:hypothetical protein